MTDPISRIPESQRAAVEQEAEEACSAAYVSAMLVFSMLSREPSEDDRRAARLAGAQAHADVVARHVVAADMKRAAERAAPGALETFQRREQEAVKEMVSTMVDAGVKSIRESAVVLDTAADMPATRETKYQSRSRVAPSRSPEDALTPVPHLVDWTGPSSDSRATLTDIDASRLIPVSSVDTLVGGEVVRVNGFTVDPPVKLREGDTVSVVVSDDGSMSVVVTPAQSKADADVSPDSDADPARFAAREAAWLQHVSNGALFDEVIARGHGRNGSLRIELPELLQTIAGLIRLIPGTEKGAEVSVTRIQGEESPAYDAILSLNGTPSTVRADYTFTYPDGETPYAIDVADAWFGNVKFHAARCRDMTEAEHDTAIVTAIAAAEETGL